MQTMRSCTGPLRQVIHGLVLLLPLYAIPPARAAAAAAERPNVILILADDLSARELGCYGHPQHRTPVLDRLAAEGVQFNTCWGAPICSPARAELMTGRYAFRTKWFHNSMKPRGEEGHFGRLHLTFGKMMQEAGYRTAIAGKWQLPGTPPDYGFDESCLWELMSYPGFDGPVEKAGEALPGRAARFWHPAISIDGKPVKTTDEDYGDDLFTDFAIDFSKRHQDRPFFLYYSMCLTHVAWDFEKGKEGYLPVPELDAQGRKTGRKVPGSLRSNVEYVDHLVGRIVHALEAQGLREKTVILFAGDNGTAGYGKSNVFQERGPLVSMIANGPGWVKARGPVDELIDFSDVLPTLADLAGHALPKDYVIDGHSFAWILRGEPGTGRDWIFAPFADKRFLRDRDWLLDAGGRFFRCGKGHADQDYVNVTSSQDPDVLAARRRLEAILQTLPAPTPEEIRTMGKGRFAPGGPGKKNQKKAAMHDGD